MNPISVIAANTFRQVVRERLFYNLLVFGVGMIVFSGLVGALTFGHAARVVCSIGLSGVSFVLDLVALLVGVALIHQEIDRKTLFVVLTRPLHRWQYAAGRYLGLVAVLATALAGLSLIFALALTLAKGSFGANEAMALLLSFPEAAIIGAFALVLSAFSTPTLSAGLGIGFWIICSTTDDLVRLSRNSGPVAESLAKFAYYALPSLARFNLREAAVYQQAIPWADTAAALVYGGLYAAFLASLAGLILSKRDMV
ncbi:MAG: ABC transporter permease subunit [Myxococcota bacterium]